MAGASPAGDPLDSNLAPSRAIRWPPFAFDTPYV
jgi:hypothetical protein